MVYTNAQEEKSELGRALKCFSAQWDEEWVRVGGGTPSPGSAQGLVPLVLTCEVNGLQRIKELPSGGSFLCLLAEDHLQQSSLEVAVRHGVVCTLSQRRVGADVLIERQKQPMGGKCQTCNTNTQIQSCLKTRRHKAIREKSSNPLMECPGMLLTLSFQCVQNIK